MFKPFERGAKTAPTAYPRLPFHLFRVFQLIASIIVASIMAYFTYHLRHDHYKEPWTFVWLFAASLASIVALAFTILAHCLVGLRPGLNVSINAFLAVLWGLSFGLLTWYMSGTLGDACDVTHWNEEVGMMVCRIYKALWTFTLVGLVSTFAGLFLDIYVRRKEMSLGAYADLDKKVRPEATVGPFTDTGKVYAHEEPRESAVWEEPRPSMGPYSELPDHAVQQQGYSHPAEFARYDTGYQGGQVGSRLL